ncbi:MAG: hypothetical protein HPY53_01880 [Brevinematales bacterium]|nr:hypothetical protein [Brevinematales bacterium]
MPSDSYVFRESQRIRVWWIWLIIIVVEGISLFMVFTYALPAMGKENIPLPGFLLPAIIVIPFLIVPFLLYFMGLETRVSSDGIYYRLLPFGFSMKRIDMKDIAKYEIVEFDPMLEMRGFGVHYTKYGKSYTMGGNQGIMIETVKGKKIMLGSQKVHEFYDAIKSVKL